MFDAASVFPIAQAIAYFSSLDLDRFRQPTKQTAHQASDKISQEPSMKKQKTSE